NFATEKKRPVMLSSIRLLAYAAVTCVMFGFLARRVFFHAPPATKTSDAALAPPSAGPMSPAGSLDAPSPTTSAAGGDRGTLLAVAVGGTCTFFLDGETKGTSATLRMALEPGTYVLTCRPGG